jgi:hypothetical protein
MHVRNLDVVEGEQQTELLSLTKSWRRDGGSPKRIEWTRIRKTFEADGGIFCRRPICRGT